MSILRENMVLRSLSKELDAHHMETTSVLEGMMFVNSTAELRQKAHQRLTQELIDIRMRREFSPTSYRPVPINLDKSVELYKALEKAGLLDAPGSDDEEE